MKRFTIIFSILLVLGFAGALAYVAVSPDFEDPNSHLTREGEDPDAPVWGMSLDEVLSALEEQGLIDRSDAQLLGASGLCSEAVKINGAEFYWWDLGNLSKDSKEYAAFQSMKEEGIIDLYGMGIIISLSDNGPFGLLLAQYEGDPDALADAFTAIGQTDGTSEDD